MIKHLTFAIAFAFLAIVAPAAAGPDRVSLLLGSDHTGGSGFDGRNPGVFLTWEDRGPGLDLSLGVYRNGYGRGSLAATISLPVARWRDGAVSVFAGAALYPENGRHFVTGQKEWVRSGISGNIWEEPRSGGKRQ